MGQFKVKLIHNLLDIELDDLVQQSKDEGFRFVERLINDYKSGSNMFNHVGESLWGVYNENGDIVAIGGLNKDPFSNDDSFGRLRRFYVRKEFRRNGIGCLLVKNIMSKASNYYQILVLHTDTKQGADFYTSIGFNKENRYPQSTHFIELRNHSMEGEGE